ncbi:replicative DNA helicase [Haloimpatiens sp. FM7315]|uniref:replicative DNA helicase n=1 Tax=Haloimpatiens sp. FM7315 TaxID=3298609 RepID=UPI003709F154
MEFSMFYDLNAETEVLSNILLNSSALLKVAEILSYKDFYNERNRILYKAITELYMDNISIDIVNLKEKLGNSLEKAGGISYMAELINSALACSDIKGHAEIIKKKSINRKFQEIITKAKKCIENNDGDSYELMDKLSAMFIELNASSKEGESCVENDLVDIMKNMEDLYKNGGKQDIIKTGYKKLDSALGGLNKQDFIIVAGRPSMGKTSVSINLLKNIILKEHKSAAFFNLEMAKKQFYQRMLSMCSSLPIDNIKKGLISTEEWITLTNLCNQISTSNFSLYDKIFKLNDIIMECRKIKMKKPLDVVIIDYLQLIELEGRYENRNVQVSKISRALKLLAKELDITVIALSQLSRAPEARSEHRPCLSDLRESGSIEQDADIVMFVYRDYYYEHEESLKNIMELLISKNRNGSVGTVKLKWLPEFQKLE